MACEPAGRREGGPSLVKSSMGVAHRSGDCTLRLSRDLETRIDFLKWLEPDMALSILTCLDDSADLICASAVSRYWQNIVVSKGLCKHLCMRIFPQLASITCVVEPSHDNSDERDHRAYASLFQALTTFPMAFCIARPVSASSTDNYPEKNIFNTMIPINPILNRGSYWLSKGSYDLETPERLIYKFTDKFCVVTDIFLHPFQDFLELGFPIYSSRFVRFRMGNLKTWKELDYDFIKAQECADDKFIWTYMSPMYLVERENRLQRFKLPDPVVCIGGYLQIELLGRVQKASDGKYYFGVGHVQAIGRKLSPAFSVEFSESSNRLSLKYDAQESAYSLYMYQSSTMS